MDEIQFDVILPVAVKDADNLSLCLDKIVKNLHPRKIVVIANREIKKILCENSHIEFCDEDTMVENLTLNNIKYHMENIKGSDTRSNWYFQQFLKMAYSIKSKTQYYLIWDSDTIPLNRIHFFETLSGGGGV